MPAGGYAVGWCFRLLLGFLLGCDSCISWNSI
jgi:hypothetical protein